MYREFDVSQKNKKKNVFDYIAFGLTRATMRSMKIMVMQLDLKIRNARREKKLFWTHNTIELSDRYSKKGC